MIPRQGTEGHLEAQRARENDQLAGEVIRGIGRVGPVAVPAWPVADADVVIGRIAVGGTTGPAVVSEHNLERFMVVDLKGTEAWIGVRVDRITPVKVQVAGAKDGGGV